MDITNKIILRNKRLKIYKILFDNKWNNHPKIIKSPDIGPVTINNPGAIYKSRPLSGMIHSAMSLRNSRNQSINLETGR